LAPAGLSQLWSAAGGVAGGLIGSLTDVGVDERDAHVYAEGIRRGGTLVSARVGDEHVDAATNIRGQSGSVNLSDRRREYEAGGSSAFDPLTEPSVDEDLDRRRRPEPMIIPPLPRWGAWRGNAPLARDSFSATVVAVIFGLWSEDMNVGIAPLFRRLGRLADEADDCSIKIVSDDDQERLEIVFEVVPRVGEYIDVGDGEQ
jgi:hypothetical protein